MKNILDEIVAQHKKDIEERGFSLGCKIPSYRERPVVPFLQGKGVILEVKRASPSKGDIAPNLDSAETAISYVKSGAQAISVLTEEHWFKGGLDDLINVSLNIGTNAAVLRKDFLLYPEEIDVAYKCGADAVLLIARVLDDEKIVSMAKRAEELGLTSLVELRLSDDLRKLELISKSVNSKFIVCGVNCRDLSDFSINLLEPSGVLEDIKKIMGNDVRVVFESGIRTPQAAEFAGGLGFTGLLLGEAAAKSPQKAESLVKAFVYTKESRNTVFWSDFAIKVHQKRTECRPFVKICGLTNEADVKLAAESGADFLGFIFSSKSPRNVTQKMQNSLKESILYVKEKQNVKTIAVITETETSEGKSAIEFVNEGVFDAVQVHGFTAALEFLKNNEYRMIPHYCAVAVKTKDDLAQLEELRKLGEPRILVDSKVNGIEGGTGVTVDENLVQEISHKQKLWLAGGINSENVYNIIQKSKPELIDISSGIENSPGIKDQEKIKQMFSILDNL